MPARDGTGPFGEGPLTGRGRGPCNVRKTRWFNRGKMSKQEEKEYLLEQKDEIDKRLKDL